MQCPICSSTTAKQQRSRLADGDAFECPNCGQFTTTRTTTEVLRHKSQTDKVKLAAYLLERKLKGEPRLILFSGEEQFFTHQSKYLAVGVEYLLKTFKPLKLSERLDKTLQNLSRLSEFPGKAVKLEESNFPLAYSENEEAFQFVLQQLSYEGFIEDPDAKNRKVVDVPCSARLTAKGWARIAELERQAPADSKQAFVAMWFDDSTNSIYDAMAKAIEESAFKPMRIDAKEHNNKICDEIVAEIRKSQFLVADFTGQRGGVYFESGFAMGLGMPVIYTCKKADLVNTHFDTRQYNYVVWEDEEDLYKKLKARILATITVPA